METQNGNPGLLVRSEKTQQQATFSARLARTVMKTAKRRTLAIVAICVTLVAALYHDAGACSRVLWRTRDNGVFVARSMDWGERIDPQLMIYPRGEQMTDAIENPATWTSQFGSLIVVGVNYNNAALDGMNEKGLTAHLLYLEATEYEKRDSRPGVSYLHWLRYVLDNNTTVANALNSLRAVQVVPVPIHGKICGVHMAIEDPSG